MRQPAPFLLAALFVAACGQAASSPDASLVAPGDAAGSSADSGTGGGPDSGPAAVFDAGGPEPTDAAALEPPDAASDELADASTSPPDASSANLCAPGFAGCAAYEDFTAAGARRDVAFSSFQYTPKCMTIAAGQSVTFTGTFSMHPLKQACGPDAVIAHTTAGTTRSFRFDVPGEYGYFCTIHGSATGTGMAGSILVQ